MYNGYRDLGRRVNDMLLVIVIFSIVFVISSYIIELGLFVDLDKLVINIYLVVLLYILYCLHIYCSCLLLPLYLDKGHDW